MAGGQAFLTLPAINPEDGIKSLGLMNREKRQSVFVVFLCFCFSILYILIIGGILR